MVQNRQKVKVNPFTFWRNLAFFGTFFKVHFLEKYTSNEAQTKPDSDGNDSYGNDSDGNGGDYDGGDDSDGNDNGGDDIDSNW